MKFNLVLLAAFLAAPILANTTPEVREAVDLADRDMSAVDEGNELTARKHRAIRECAEEHLRTGINSWIIGSDATASALSDINDNHSSMMIHTSCAVISKK
ncbi:hypothetical protein MGYG_05154 [Nannizzia gypsea CBS 118893]|uniref:UrcA family protein n=1 Tax=Arthroderma gypseum (strain ATCC MYA-4604 / CBS 118893) TaxID=535722 RepID=E4UYI8_ARTGP|nr:hypothetical protein MGYG_05154 [Nannizzia gypsea CBS 118893]EFR02151.1 hypothetical protein MGYG_05154 [Nannizzia gypsea CBS 118893]